MQFVFVVQRYMCENHYAVSLKKYWISYVPDFEMSITLRLYSNIFLESEKPIRLQKYGF